MIELLRSNDAVILSFAEALLRDAGIKCAVLDRHMSFTEGSVDALNQRLMVRVEDETHARALIAEAGI